MSELTSKFSKDDIEALLEAADHWEAVGNQDFHIMNAVRDAPMPPEDNEAYEFVKSIKDHYRTREKDIRATRIVRKERAIFLKAKLLLVKSDMTVNQLFNMEVEEPAKVEDPAKVEEPAKIPSATSHKISETQNEIDEFAQNKALSKLERAEFFIRDLGVWEHYTKFLEKEKIAAESSK